MESAVEERILQSPSFDYASHIRSILRSGTFLRTKYENKDLRNYQSQRCNRRY